MIGALVTGLNATVRADDKEELDEAMLNNADIAVVVKSARSGSLVVNRPGRVIRTGKPGPAGWQQAMDELLGDSSLS